MATVRRKSPEPALELDVLGLMEAIERERQHRGLTYQQVSEQLRIGYTTLCYWRRGGTSIGGNIALRIAVWLNIDLRNYAKEPADQPATQKVA